MNYQKKAEQSPSSGSSLYRALLTAAAAAGIAFGFGGSSAPAQTNQTPKQAYSARATYKPTLTTLVSQQDVLPATPQDPPQEPKAEPKQEPKPEPYAKTPQELDLEHKAYVAYKSGRDAKPEDQLKLFVESYKLYEQAEAIAPPVTYADELKTLKDWASAAYFKDDKLIVKNLAPEQAKELDAYIANYGKPAPKPEPKPEPKIEPKPEPKQDPPKQDVPPQPKPEPQPEPQQPDKVPAEPKKGPYDSNLLSAKAGLGPYHRAGGAYLKLSGIEALADFERNTFTTENDDEIRRQHIGLYAEADFDKMFGIPLRGHVTGEQFEEILGSLSSDVQDDPFFNIATRTTSKTTTTRTYLDLGGELRLGDYGLMAELFQLEEDIDVDVETLLTVINKLDPAGNYTDTIRNNQNFKNTTQGFQFGPKAYLLDDRINAGLLFTYESTDMPDFDRHLRRIRWHPFMSFMSENRNWGFYAIAGESLLTDNGERLTDPEYGAVIGAELSDRVAVAGRFSRREQNPRGMMTLLYCKDNKALEYLLENERIKVHAELNLIKNISPSLIDDYIRIRDDQLLRWIADKDGFKFRLEGGAARVMRDGKEEILPMYGGDILTPVLWDTVALGAGFYRFEGEESKTTGVRFHIFPKNKDWKITLMGEQEEIDGLGIRDRRGLLVWDIWSK